MNVQSGANSWHTCFELTLFEFFGHAPKSFLFERFFYFKLFLLKNFLTPNVPNNTSASQARLEGQTSLSLAGQAQA